MPTSRGKKKKKKERNGNVTAWKDGPQHVVDVKQTVVDPQL